jgi:hypothetical protein
VAEELGEKPRRKRQDRDGEQQQEIDPHHDPVDVMQVVRDARMTDPHCPDRGEAYDVGQVLWP